MNIQLKENEFPKLYGIQNKAEFQRIQEEIKGWDLDLVNTGFVKPELELQGDEENIRGWLLAEGLPKYGQAIDNQNWRQKLSHFGDAIMHYTQKPILRTSYLPECKLYWPTQEMEDLVQQAQQEYISEQQAVELIMHPETEDDLIRGYVKLPHLLQDAMDHGHGAIQKSCLDGWNLLLEYLLKYHFYVLQSMIIRLGDEQLDMVTSNFTLHAMHRLIPFYEQAKNAATVS